MTVLPSAEKVDAPDRDAIERVVQLYVDGFNDCDVDKFIQAFHEDAWIFFTHRDGTLYKGLIADSFEEWATPPAQRIVGRVISVTQAGDIASVLLGFDNADDLFDGWVDLHTLLRIDGTWKIMNKTANALQQGGLGRSQSARRTGRAGLTSSP
jgi:ketosteroid isomerase-like protein